MSSCPIRRIQCGESSVCGIGRRTRRRPGRRRRLMDVEVAMSFLTGIVCSRAACVAATVVTLSCSGEEGGGPDVGSVSSPSVSVQQTPLDGARVDKYVE